MSRIDIGRIFTKEGIAQLEKGQVLGFQEEGKKEPTHYKIVRLKPRQKKVIVEKIKLYRPEEVDVVDKRRKTQTEDPGDQG